MQKITHNGKEYKAQLSNLRVSHGEGFDKLMGCHRKSQKECGACVVFTIAAILDGDVVYTGLAKRSRNDMFNKKTGRAIAIGRALKSMVEETKQTKTFATAQEFVDQLKALRALEMKCQQTPGIHNQSLDIAIHDMYHIQPRRAR